MRNLSSSTTTLLVFTLGPGCEGARRRLLPGPLRQAELMLHQHGLDGAVGAGQRCGFRVVVSSPRRLPLPNDVEQLPQEGEGFGERLRLAIRRLQLENPGAPVVVVGTDTPGLESRHLAAAVAHLRLEADGVVLGPSLDGGFYLLATRGSIDDELRQASWCRSDTLASLIGALRRSGKEVSLLAPLRDLDHASDLEAWLSEEARSTPGHPLGRLLCSLLATWRRPAVPRVFGCPQPSVVALVASRGPPV